MSLLRLNSAVVALRATLLSTLLVATSCFWDQPPPAEERLSRAALRRYQQVACTLPPQELRRIWNGFQSARSGEIQMFLEEPHAFAYAHAGPEDHLQDVPLFFYGPGQVGRAAGPVRRPVTMADVAPTLGKLLGFRFRAPDGRSIREVDALGREPPRLILVIVWDGAGRNVLAEYPDSWPTLRRLLSDGVRLEAASLGTAPSVTPPIHATLGTGAYPRRHGLVDIYIRVGREIEPSFGQGPQYLQVPALADVYDRSRGNDPKIGMVASRDWHLGMIGQGSYRRGGDRDLAVLLDERRGRWALPGVNARYFGFPEYVNDVPGLEAAVRELDLEDGLLDGTWRGEDLSDPLSLRRTPAFSAWQTRVIEEVIRREGFGADRIPDLFFTNYKQIDEVGHRWTMHSPQMEAVVRASDEALAQLVDILDQEVGKGRWVVVLTSDHGLIPSRAVTGGFDVKKERFTADLEEAFGKRVVQQFRPTQLWLDREVLADNGHGLDDVATFVGEYTKGDNASDPDELSAAEREERLFRAVFPSEAMRDLPCLPRRT